MRNMFKKIALVTCISASMVSAYAKPNELIIEPSYEVAAQVVTAVLDSQAYDKHEVNQEFSQHVFKTFLESVDPSRLFFTQEDIKKWDSLSKVFVNQVRDAQLESGFDVFRIYRDKLIKRYNWVLERLDQPFDLTTHRMFLLDRSKSEWEKDEKALNQIWEDRLTNDYLRLYLNNEKDSKIRTTLKKRYENTRKSLLKYSSEEVAQLVINSVAEAMDPHNSWMGPEASDQFRIDMSLSLEGVGIQIQNRGDYNVVREVIKGGPADKVGMFSTGDLIVSVGQGKSGPMQDVVGYRINDLVKLIRGKRGTVVRLGIRKMSEGGEDAPIRIYEVVRDHIKQEEQAARSRILDVKRHQKNYKIGYLTISSFYATSFSSGSKKGQSLTADVKKVLEDYHREGVDGLVIDLRNNGGGSLYEVANLSGLFIGARQVVVQVRDSDGNVENVYSKTFQPKIWDKPVVLMINRYSASASEIFAGVMKDYQRGLVVGNTTWGKGSVQTFEELSELLSDSKWKDLGGFKWTVQMFFRPNGSSTQVKGVTPDIEFPTSIHMDEYGEVKYENALPWREIAPASYKPLGLPKSLAVLKNAHEVRTKSSEVWNLLKQEKEFEYTYLNNKEVSLNLQERLERRDFMKKKRAFFEAERKRLGESSVNVFKLDDGLSYNEGNLSEQVAEEKALRDLVDIEAREAAEMVVDQLP